MLNQDTTNRTKIWGPELVKRQVFPTHFSSDLFEGIFQAVNSTDLHYVKYFFET